MARMANGSGEGETHGASQESVGAAITPLEKAMRITESQCRKSQGGGSEDRVGARNGATTFSSRRSPRAER